MRGYWFLLLYWKLSRLPEGPLYTIVVTWWILDFRERSTHRNACCIIHLTHPTHSLPRHNMSEVYKFVSTGEVLLRHIFLHSV